MFPQPFSHSNLLFFVFPVKRTDPFAGIFPQIETDQDTRTEVVKVPVSIPATFHDLDLVIDPFPMSIGQGVDKGVTDGVQLFFNISFR